MSIRNQKKWNKKGAVNSYRFIAMYLIIGFIITGTSLIGQSTSNSDAGYKMKSEGKLSEIALNKDKIITQSLEIVQANQYALTSDYGIGRSSVGAIEQALVKGFIPVGFISQNDYTATPLERRMNWMLMIFQGIIGLFAIIEIYQIIVKNKVT